MRILLILPLVAVMWACREAPDARGGGAAPQDVPVSAGPDPWEAARARGIEYRALGQEPGWYLEIDEGVSMRLVYDYGERDATTPAPRPSREDGATVYHAATDAHDLRVVVEERPCSDVMSGLPFPDTVTVTIDGRSYRGCGRDLR